ncbi:MAG TPA: hypothetical protein VFV17_04160 [Usitatibacteraceae bacterium]|nr:hypothetical protein [Usitatibacteraceae bacterium]
MGALQKFGFRIQTRGGLMVDHLVIQGIDQPHAEAKLRQMYHHCKVVECRAFEHPAVVDATDLEGAINLIARR